MNKDIEVSLDILPDGNIRFSRFDPETNDLLVEVLTPLTSKEKLEEVKQFLDGANNIEHIFGDEPLCG